MNRAMFFDEKQFDNWMMNESISQSHYEFAD